MKRGRLQVNGNFIVPNTTHNKYTEINSWNYVVRKECIIVNASEVHTPVCLILQGECSFKKKLAWL